MTVLLVLLSINLILWLLVGELLGKDEVAARLMFISMAFVLAFRATSVGTDTAVACNQIERIGRASLLSITSMSGGIWEYAPVYTIWCKLIWMAIPSPHAVLAVNAVATCTSYYYFFSKFSSRSASCAFLYLSSYAYINAFNTMRQELAIAVCLLALTFWSLRRRALGVAVAAAAIGVHVIVTVPIAAVAAYAALPALRAAGPRRLLGVCLLAGLVGRVFYGQLSAAFFSLFARYGRLYGESATDYVSAGRTIVIYLAFLAVFVFWTCGDGGGCDRGCASTARIGKRGFLPLWFFLGFLCLSLNLFFFDLALPRRVAACFMPYLILILQKALDGLGQRWQTVAPGYFVISGLILSFVFRLVANIGGVVPFAFFW